MLSWADFWAGDSFRIQPHQLARKTLDAIVFTNNDTKLTNPHTKTLKLITGATII